MTRLNMSQIATTSQGGAGCNNERLSAAVLGAVHLILVVVVYNYVCECTVGVDVRDGATHALNSILSVVMGCIVLGRQMNVDFSIFGCRNTIRFVGMDVRFGSMKIHDSMIICTTCTAACSNCRGVKK